MTPERIRGRQGARMACAQALYQMEIAAASAEQVISEFSGGGAEWPARTDPAHFETVVRGAEGLRTPIDAQIAAALATGWRLSRMDATLRGILRAGVYELAYQPGIPARVVINAYLDVGRAFFDDKEVRLINGILDTVCRAVRPGALEDAAPGSP